MESENLAKLHVDLPNHWAVGGESMWAQPLGADIYEIRNIPFYAYDLNFLDVVEAIPASPELKPSIRRVVRRSGHRTLRVIFFDSTPAADRVPLLESLSDLGTSYEGATEKLFAIDIKPEEGDYQGVCDRLLSWESQGLLEYETCEARVEGSFDGRPDDWEDEHGVG